MTKENILHTATEMFLELGFKSVTMDDLAHKMGISKKTIYSHFENKNLLVQECTLCLFDHISDGIDHICSHEKNPIEELYEIKKYVMQHLKGETSSPEYQLKKYYPKIHTKLKLAQFQMMQGCVRNNLNRGVEMGIYRPNLNVEFVTRIYYAGVTSIKDNKLFPIENFTMEQLTDWYVEYHLRGIVTPKGRKILNEIINSNQE